MGRLFEGKVAVVTGAGRGIGREEALLLAREGASVVVNDLGGSADGATDSEAAIVGAAQVVVNEIVAAGGTAAANTDDISSWDGAEILINQAVQTYGGLDVVINNAGILRDRMSFNMSEEDWDSVMAVHLKGHFSVARHAAAYWKQRSKTTGEPVGAAIVNTASESGLYGNAGQVNYAASKAGLIGFMGVRVNAIAPVARTRLTAALAGDYMLPDESGFDRFSPDNVAAVTCWLASDLAQGISGQVIKVQGGQIQLLEGWRPLIEITDDKTWTLDSVAARREELFPTAADGAVPPFFFGPPPADRERYPQMDMG